MQHSSVRRNPAEARPRVLLHRRHQSSIHLAGKDLSKAWRVTRSHWMHSIDEATTPRVSRLGLGRSLKNWASEPKCPCSQQHVTITTCHNTDEPSPEYSRAGSRGYIGMHR